MKGKKEINYQEKNEKIIDLTWEKEKKNLQNQ